MGSRWVYFLLKTGLQAQYISAVNRVALVVNKLILVFKVFSQGVCPFMQVSYLSRVQSYFDKMRYFLF